MDATPSTFIALLLLAGVLLGLAGVFGGIDLSAPPLDEETVYLARRAA